METGRKARSWEIGSRLKMKWAYIGEAGAEIFLEGGVEARPGLDSR